MLPCPRVRCRRDPRAADAPRISQGLHELPKCCQKRSADCTERRLQLFHRESAKNASERYGWPLHVIENAADDPKLEQPEVFLQALYTALETTVEQGSGDQSKGGKR